MDIDHADKGDPLAVVEYIDDIFANYRKQEVMQFLFGSILMLIWLTKIGLVFVFIINGFKRFLPSL